MKLRKKPADTKIFCIDFTNLLDSDDTIESINSITVTPEGLLAEDEEVNSSVINETILPGKAVTFTGSEGTDGYEYVITCEVTTVDDQIITASVDLLVTEATQIPIDYYGNILRAGEYFKNRLETTAWDDSENPRQRIALFEATQLIDKLNFAGTKADSEQLLEFPRANDTDIPRNIEFATYEIAYELLDGVEVNKEIEKLNVESQGYASVRQTYNRTSNPEYVAAGIPSAKAWQLLKPYLRDTRFVKISRVN